MNASEGGQRPMRDRGDRGPRGIRRTRPKVCQYCVDQINNLDYKDYGRIRPMVTERGKIKSRGQTGTCAKHQRMVARAIKRARQVALLPFVAE
jgi:small subunit ribosomal protein S18